MAGSLMKYYEQQILNLTNGARKQLMQKCMETILFDENGNSRFEYNVVVAIVLAGAKIGVGREAPLNQQEKELSKIVAKKVFRNYTEEEVVNAIESFALKTTYDVVSALTAIADQDVAMAYFHYILCWALADGVIDDAMEGKIASLFGMKLILDFADNGPESVPTPKIQLTGLEAEIALWLKNDDQAVFFHDVQSHFPRKTNSEIKKALDSLCEKGVLSCVKTFAGDMYSLENDNIHTNAVAENRAPKAPEKPKANQPSAAQRENERIKQAILEHLKSSSGFCTVSDMITEVKACSGLSTPKMAELLRQMEKEGLVERIVDGKKTYFRTCGAGNSISAAKNRASATSGSAAKSRESATSGSAMPLTAAQRENERIKQAILEHLKAGQLYMISDMIIEVEACSGLSTPKMAGLLRQMEKEGLVERIVDGKKAYFRTCGAGNSISVTKSRASATSDSAVKKPKSAASDSAAKNRESATSGSAMPLTATQRENERIKQAILAHLKAGQLYMISDMIIEVKACSGLSTPKVSGVLYMLEKEGLVERIVIDDTQYYYIK